LKKKQKKKQVPDGFGRLLISCTSTKTFDLFTKWMFLKTDTPDRFRPPMDMLFQCIDTKQGLGGLDYLWLWWVAVYGA